jgi:hypothetical protein
MNKTARRAVFFLFLGLFLLAAPAVVLYTAGYRFNLQRMTLVKTGILAVSSEPKGATIFLDNNETRQKTNAVLKNIMPGEHTVRLSKDGYFPWEKKLTVEESETTFVQKTSLFLADEMVVWEAGEDYPAFALSNSGETIAFAAAQGSWVEIWTRRLSSGEEKLMFRLPKNSLNDLSLVWSLDDSLLYLKKNKTEKSWLAIDQNGQSRETTEPLSIWERDANQRLLVKENNLVKQDVNGLEQTLATLPEGRYDFRPAVPTTVLLQDKTKNKIVLVDDRGGDQPILLQAEAFTTAWNPQNEKQLLYASDFEIHLFDTEKLFDELLTRLSLPIAAAAWAASGDKIFYSDGARLFALELDNRGGQRQSWILAELEKIEAVAPSQDGRAVYLVGKKEKEAGLFKRRLAE